jgi:hypothetical protein
MTLRPADPEVELDALLTKSRPEPAPEWVDALEERLLPRRISRPHVIALPRLRVGVGIAVGLAVLLIVLGLAGAGPLSDEAPNVRAKEDCQLVRVTRTERVPVVATAPDGSTTVSYRRERVERLERRCRVDAVGGRH